MCFNDLESARTRLETSSEERGGDIAVRGVTDGSIGSVAVVAVEASDNDEAPGVSSPGSSSRLRFRSRLFTRRSTSAFIRFRKCWGVGVPRHKPPAHDTHTHYIATLADTEETWRGTTNSSAPSITLQD